MYSRAHRNVTCVHLCLHNKRRVGVVTQAQCRRQRRGGASAVPWYVVAATLFRGGCKLPAAVGHKAPKPGKPPIAAETAARAACGTTSRCNALMVPRYTGLPNSCPARQARPNADGKVSWPWQSPRALPSACPAIVGRACRNICRPTRPQRPGRK